MNVIACDGFVRWHEAIFCFGDRFALPASCAGARDDVKLLVLYNVT